MFEITTHRAEAYAPDSRKPDVSFADAGRGRPGAARLHRERHGAARDRRDDEVPELIDPFDGVADLAAGRLRTPLAPEVSFSDDPLRMLRAARFLAGYGLVPDDDLVAAAVTDLRRTASRSCPPSGSATSSTSCSSSRTRARAVVPRRHRARRRHPPRAARHARRAGPDPPPQGRARPHDRRGRQDRARRSCVRLAALLHDVGKPKTRSIGPKGVSFHHHEVVGARMARDRLRALRFPNDAGRRRSASSSSCTCASTATATTAGPTAPCAATSATPAPLLDELNELTRCDCTTRNERKARQLAGAHGRARGAHRRAARARGARAPSAPTSTARR